jgi:hypothetical protein
MKTFNLYSFVKTVCILFSSYMLILAVLVMLLHK